MDELFQKVKKGKYSLPLTLSKEIVDFINKMLQQDPNQRYTANQLLYHDFLTKPLSQFQPIDTIDIQASLGPGGVLNVKSTSQPKIDTNSNLYDLWSIFSQPGIYQGMPQQMNQIQPVMQLGQQYNYISQPQQHYYMNQNPVITQVQTGGYY